MIKSGFANDLSQGFKDNQHKLDKLPMKYQEILKDKYIKLKKINNIAKEYGISSIDVKTILDLALNTLKKIK